MNIITLMADELSALARGDTQLRVVRPSQTPPFTGGEILRVDDSWVISGHEEGLGRRWVVGRCPFAPIGVGDTIVIAENVAGSELPGTLVFPDGRRYPKVSTQSYSCGYWTNLEEVNPLDFRAKVVVTQLDFVRWFDLTESDRWGKTWDMVFPGIAYQTNPYVWVVVGDLLVRESL